MKKYIAELIGTFALVFFGTGAVIISSLTENSLGLTGISIAFGLVVTVMIYTFGNISGAHINPAVSIAFAIKDKSPIKDTLLYIAFQVTGAILASVILSILFPTDTYLGTTLPSGTVSQSFIMEFISTFFLMLVILGVTQQGTAHTKAFTGLVIGATVTTMIFTAGPVSGGSFNPARSIGPALISGKIQYLWLYIISPTLGAITATLIWKYLTSSANTLE